MRDEPPPQYEFVLDQILDVLVDIRELLTPKVKCKGCGEMAPDYSGGSCEDCCIK